MADVLRSVDVVRVRGVARAAEIDRAATEEPLEVRLHGQPFAVIMRTPGADRELTAGFLLSERVITSADDLGTIEYCTDRQGRDHRRANGPRRANGRHVSGQRFNRPPSAQAAGRIRHHLTPVRHQTLESLVGSVRQRHVHRVRSVPVASGLCRTRLVASSVGRT